MCVSIGNVKGLFQFAASFIQTTMVSIVFIFEMQDSDKRISL